MSPAGTTPAGGVAPATRRVMNLATFLAQAARRHPDGIAVSEGGRDISWAALQARSAALAAALAARGIAKGDRVLVHGRNSIAYIETLFAVFRLGAVWVPTNFRISPDEAAYLAQASGARAFLCDGVFDAHARAVSQAMPDL
ncbi:AMP-binding protein, partial [Bordetella hinzii]|nr:AMP-binding protein [Bordetella hinzii]